MSNSAQAVIQQFNNLPQAEQLAVYEAIARKVTPADYGPLSDEDLTAIAAETFGLLEPGAELLDGTPVRVETTEPGSDGSSAGEYDPFRMGERAVETGIPDLATNVDHYLYGHPKVSHAG